MVDTIRRAVVMNDVEMLNQLLSSSEVVNISCYDNVCIKWAISNGYFEIVRLLFAYGLTVPLTDDEIAHNLNIAIHNKHTETVDYVMNYYSIDKSKLTNGFLMNIR